MSFDSPRKPIRKRNHDFASEIIHSLSEEPMDEEDMIDIAQKHYETEQHARVLGLKQVRELQKDNYISNNGENYFVTVDGKKAFNIFDEDLEEDDSEITRYLLNGGKYRTRN